MTVILYYPCNSHNIPCNEYNWMQIAGVCVHLGESIQYTIIVYIIYIIYNDTHNCL